MLRVRHISVSEKKKKTVTSDKYITDFVVRTTWSGSDTQVCRIAQLDVANNPFDKKIQIDIKLGDLIYLYEDNKNIFQGVVTSRSRTDEVGTVSYTVKDFMFYLLKSKGTYVFKKKKAETIAQVVCNDLQIKTTNLYKTKVSLNEQLIFDAVTYYNIILKAYNQAAKKMSAKNPPIFMPVMSGKALSVIAKGQTSGIMLKLNADITSSSYEENLESMINQVMIYKDSGEKVKIVSNKNWVKKYGILQEAYKEEKDVNSTNAAKQLLTGVEKTASISAIGNVACRAGYSVKIKDSVTLLCGKFFITNDSHTWENGIHTMTLELKFKNELEEV